MNKWTDASFNKIQTLATLAVMLIGAVMYVSEIEKDVAILQSNQAAMKSQIAEYQADNKAMFLRIDQKLDQMINIIHTYKE
jgi:hypothetical protein